MYRHTVTPLTLFMNEATATLNNTVKPTFVAPGPGMAERTQGDTNNAGTQFRENFRREPFGGNCSRTVPLREDIRRFDKIPQRILSAAGPNIEFRRKLSESRIDDERIGAGKSGTANT